MTWTCSQSPGSTTTYATPALCSLDGSTVSLVVGSSDGIYKIDLYNATFQAGSARWPWSTFHRDAARTGCVTSPSTTYVSASVIGRVTSQSTGLPIPGASVKVEWYDGTNWVIPEVYGRSNSRYPIGIDSVTTVGQYDDGSEINEGGYVINQLPPNRSYRLTITATGYIARQVTVPVTTGRTPPQDIALAQ
jgi:hypothetical protein